MHRRLKEQVAPPDTTVCRCSQAVVCRVGKTVLQRWLRTNLRTTRSFATRTALIPEHFSCPAALQHRALLQTSACGRHRQVICAIWPSAEQNVYGAGSFSSPMFSNALEKAVMRMRAETAQAGRQPPEGPSRASAALRSTAGAATSPPLSRTPARNRAIAVRRVATAEQEHEHKRIRSEALLCASALRQTVGVKPRV